MRFVFLIFKLMELILCIACVAIHIEGFLYKMEPFAHEFYFCGLYFSYTVLTLLGIGALFVGIPVSLMYEILVSFSGAALFGVAIFVSMGHAETDYHLTYLSDKEEFYHEYFFRLRLQSIFSLTETFLLLLHGILTLDVYLAIKNGKHELPVVYPGPEEDHFADPEVDHHPTELFLLNKPVVEFLLRKFPKVFKNLGPEVKK